MVAMAPPPSFDVLELRQGCLRRLELSVVGDGQDELGRARCLRGRARLGELLGRASIESLEAGDKVAFPLGAVRAQAGVLRVGEEGTGADVVGGGPAWLESVGGLVARSRLELGNAVGQQKAWSDTALEGSPTDGPASQRGR